MTVIAEIAAERERQKAVEGWDDEHDDEHGDDALAIAAACYALPDSLRHCQPRIEQREIGMRGLADPPTYEKVCTIAPSIWPWAGWWWKPNDRRRDLIRAAALIAAEIERLDRAALAEQEKPR